MKKPRRRGFFLVPCRCPRVSSFSWPVKLVQSAPTLTTARLGELLMGPMVVPFEVISLVLVVALIGAIFFSRSRS